MKSPLIPTLFLLSLLLVAGCSDDDPGTPESFQVTITVVDTLGHPVEGLELNLAPDSPLYMDGQVAAKDDDLDPIPAENRLYPVSPNPFYPATRITFENAHEGPYELSILDIEKNLVTTLGSGIAVAGTHQIQWGGSIGADQVAPSGVYFAHLELRQAEGLDPVYTAEQPMLLARWGTFSPPIAVTDAEGRIVLNDRRLFPDLFDLEPFPAMDENGEQIGLVELSPTMRFYLTDPENSRTLRFDGDVTGTKSFTFTWE